MMIASRVMGLFVKSRVRWIIHVNQLYWGTRRAQFYSDASNIYTAISSIQYLGISALNV